nr:hypothetical protein [uncultured Tolumonas sp.]
MKNKFNYKHLLTALCFVGTTLIAAIPPAYAGVANNGLFEVDGDPQDAISATAPDDWETPPKEGIHNVLKFTGIISDPYPQSIFDGGKKDIQDVTQWSWGNGAVPDKDNITNAYAAAYKDETDPTNPQLMIYFGADRYANTGDAFMGFWFFQQQVAANSTTGKFSGAHTNGDTLVLVNYPQAAGAVPYIAVINWDTTCTKAASNTPTPGQCAAANLRLKSESNGSTPALCDSTANQDACAITNLGEVNSPWPYVPKAGTTNKFPYESFFEGGINLSKLAGNTCFSSYMAETRSSSSFTASLKDFALGSFETCGVKIVKTCTNSELSADNSAIKYTFGGSVTNNGFGTIYDVKVRDNNGTPIDSSDDFDIVLAGGVTMISQGETVAFESPLTFTSTENGALNGVAVTAAATPGGTASITANTTAQCEKLALSPVISVSKNCSTAVVSDGTKLNVKVNYTGTVCNKAPSSGVDGPITLNNVAVVDNSGTPADPTDDTIPVIKDTTTPLKGQTLTAGSCLDFTGSYYPATAGSIEPKNISFSDKVTASGQSIRSEFGSAQDTATATCPLCPTCPDCPTTP